MADQIGRVELSNTPRILRVNPRQQSKQKNGKDFSSWLQNRKKKQDEEKDPGLPDDLLRDQHDEITLTSAAEQQPHDDDSTETPSSSAKQRHSEQAEKVEKESEEHGPQSIDITV